MSIYKNFKRHPLWDVLESLLLELESNQDIEIKTNLEYVVGFIIKNINSRLNDKFTVGAEIE